MDGIKSDNILLLEKAKKPYFGFSIYWFYAQVQ